MLKYRIYMALIIGIGFAALVFLVMTCLSPNLAVGMIGVAVLMPGIGLLGVIRDQCCASPLPMLAANGLIYSGLPFLWCGWEPEVTKAKVFVVSRVHLRLLWPEPSP